MVQIPDANTYAKQIVKRFNEIAERVETHPKTADLVVDQLPEPEPEPKEPIVPDPIPVFVVNANTREMWNDCQIATYVLALTSPLPFRLVAPQAGRTQIVIQNLGPGTLYVGKTDSLNIAVNCFALAIGQVLSLNYRGGLWVTISAGLTVQIFEEYEQITDEKRGPKSWLRQLR